MNYSTMSLLPLTVLTALGFGMWHANQHADEVGTVVLAVVDADSGKPIANVTFAIENALAEMWAEPVGKSDLSGKLQLESKVRRGYFYCIYPVPDGYKVTGLDAVPTGITPGETVEHRFHLRKLNTNVDVPELIPRSDLLRTKSGSLSTETMPGFCGQTVNLWVDQAIAEDLFRNGARLRAAIDDELSYFKKAEGEKAGDITKIKDVKIVPTTVQDGEPGWTVWCRTEGGMNLKQDGFKIEFDSKFQSWNLHVPDYLHPSF